MVTTTPLRIKSTMNVIETNQLTKYYGKTRGIDGVDLSIKTGEIFGFIGPNGAGKSTTIRLLLDLIRPTKGSAKIFGLDINKQSLQIRQQIGYLPGEIFLADNISGQECIEYYSSFKDKVDKKFLNDLIKRFEFDAKKKISEYSKGNKQKLAIILALMHQPKLLILDEPTSGLDPLNQQEFYKVVKEAQKNGASVFFSTHILDEASKLCDRVGIIREGKLLKIENIDDFRQKNIREIHFETTCEIPLSDLKTSGVIEVKKSANGYHFITSGDNAIIIKLLAKYDFSDIKILEPSLEESFFHYYQKQL